MANQVRIEANVYRINPDDDRQLQRRSINGTQWSYVTGVNGYHILDLLLAPNGHDIEVYTDHGVYLREYSGCIRKK